MTRSLRSLMLAIVAACGHGPEPTFPGRARPGLERGRGGRARVRDAGVLRRDRGPQLRRTPRLGGGPTPWAASAEGAARQRPAPDTRPGDEASLAVLARRPRARPG